MLDSEVVGQLEHALEEREEELTAAREAHRRLMAEHNRVTARTRCAHQPAQPEGPVD